MFVRFAFAAAALLVASSTLAGPREELQAAYTKFLTAKSFRATMTDVRKNEQINTMEYVAPNRYRMQMQGGMSMVVIGNTGWMNMGGRWAKAPMPVEQIVSQYRNPERLRGIGTVTVLGTSVVDGEPVRGYRYTATEAGHTADVKSWVSVRSGMPLQFESTSGGTTVRVRYRDYNASIQITPPN